MISESAFNQTIWALKVYAEHQEAPLGQNEPQMLLRLTRKQGQLVLEPVLSTKLGFGDKALRFFGVGRCSLRRIVRFLQSKSFFYTLENTTLTNFEQKSILHATHLIDTQIRKYNTGMFFPIATQRRNLTQTVKEHFFKVTNSHAVSQHLVHKKAVSYTASHPIDALLIAPHLLPVATLLQKGEFAKATTEIGNQEVDAISKHELKSIAESYCKQQIAEEILSGRAVVDKKGVLTLSRGKTFVHDFGALFPGVEREFTDWARLLQEIRRTSNKTTSPASELQMNFIEDKCAEHKLPVPSHDTILRLQKTALEGLLHNDTFPSKHDIETIKLKTYLTACKVPEADQDLWIQALGVVTWTKDIIRKQYAFESQKLVKEITSRSLPAIAEQKLLADCKDHITYEVSRNIETMTKFSLSDICNMDLTEFRKPEFKLLIANSISTFREEEILPSFQFYVKWQKYLVQEMSQGHNDPGEILGDGICWALSLRWVEAELNLAAGASVDQAVSRMRMGKTYDRDRKTQAAYGLAFSKPFIKASTNAKVGLHKKKRVFWAYSIFGTQKIAQNLKNLGNTKTFQGQYKGVGQLSFQWGQSAHAICFVCRKDQQNPSQSVLRFSEPNFGTYNFIVEGNTKADLEKAENNLYTCLAELITTMYTKTLTRLQCDCYESTRPPVPPSAAAV
ncbi:MAG: hypothetical protein LLF94_03395 [Chlamydiales bacterium]|nr:hypothetical protein [Chlamydiales bacterium]